MKNFWENYKFRIIGAILGILIHLGLIGLTYRMEGQAFLILGFMDLPITLLLYPVDWLGIRVWESVLELIYLIGGTLMYAVLGWFMGPFIERQALLYGFGSSGSNDR